MADGRAGIPSARIGLFNHRACNGCMEAGSLFLNDFKVQPSSVESTAATLGRLAAFEVAGLEQHGAGVRL